MLLGHIIDALATYPADSEVQIEGPRPMVPLRLQSYRGYYEDLAISFMGHDGANRITVDRFRNVLQKAVGASFEGYKGGAFIMTRETRVWVANWGDSPNCRVNDVYQNDGITYLGLRMGRT